MNALSYTGMTNVDIGRFADVAIIVDVRRQSTSLVVIDREANRVRNRVKLITTRPTG